jgi:hypothetical protein
MYGAILTFVFQHDHGCLPLKNSIQPFLTSLQPLWHAKRVIALAKISILPVAETLRFVDL